MTTRKAPLIERRTAQDIFDYLAKRLNLAAGGDPLGEALLRVFARYSEIIIDRLNQAPDKNYLAFLNLLGVTQIPPSPAQAPLTFQPVKQFPQTLSVLVPAHTQVAAPGGGEPIVFETTRSLALTAVILHKVIACDPQADLYADRSALASLEETRQATIFTGELPIRHEFYLSQEEIFGHPDLSQLRVQVELEHSRPVPPTSPLVEWWIPTAKGNVILIPSQDTTAQLTRSGEVVFDNLPAWPAYRLCRQETQWLACRLLQRLQVPARSGSGEPATWLPRIRSLTLSALWKSKETAVTQALFNNLPLDTSKDFFPFGERPRFGDVFYLNCDAFVRHKATVVLQIQLTNPASASKPSPLRPVNRNGNPQLHWEGWNGERWLRLDCHDDTQALTETGTVRFTVPATAVRTTVNGLAGAWLRVRLVAGNYGEEERFEWVREQGGAGVRHQPSTLAPPSIRSLTVLCTVTAGPLPPKAIVTHNNLAFATIDPAETSSLAPFQPAEDHCRALYLGFKAPGRELLAGRVIDLYCQPAEPAERLFTRAGQSQQAPVLSWQYWNGDRWMACNSNDNTACLSVPGVVRLCAGEDIVPWREAALDPAGELYWFRLRWEGGEFHRLPVLQRLAVNTVPATHTVTLQNELLGSSTGGPRQTLTTTRVPIIGDVQLEVREPEVPTAAELARLRQEEGEDAVSISRDARGLIQEVWVRWHEVKDWLGSSAQDRHYVVARLTGAIHFGDGVRGRIPPPGANNIRLRRYQTGGGVRGNQPARSLVQLRTSIPFVAAVTNPEVAAGGQDIESWDSVRERGSRWLRHRERAVTAEDYEDLARASSPAVARAKCYPLRDLAEDPGATTSRPGSVSVIIVPHSPAPSPKPDAALLRDVQGFLDQCRTPEVSLVVLAPEYVRVSIIVAIAAATAAEVDPLKECEQRLAAYLHPLTGGLAAQGWDFGRLPQSSDLYALLESVRGVDYIQSLRLETEEERPGLLQSGIFLLCSGQHRISLQL